MHLLGIGEWMGSILGPNCILAKYIRSCNYCCYKKGAILKIEVEIMPWPKKVQINTNTMGLDFRPTKSCGSLFISTVSISIDKYVSPCLHTPLVFIYTSSEANLQFQISVYPSENFLGNVIFSAPIQDNCLNQL